MFFQCFIIEQIEYFDIHLAIKYTLVLSSINILLPLYDITNSKQHPVFYG